MNDDTLPLARYQPAPFPTLPIVIRDCNGHISEDTARRLLRDLADALRILDAVKRST